MQDSQGSTLAEPSYEGKAEDYRLYLWKLRGFSGTVTVQFSKWSRCRDQALGHGILDEVDRRVEVELLHDLGFVKFDGSM